ncbi:MAG: hypothetical protein KC448_03460 [Yoonia sp.]|nr:hypothetical protein [Yoonia sp.]
MKIAFAAIALTVIAGQATALSCVRPDAVRTFERVSEDSDSYYLLYGTLDFDATKQPKGVVNEERNPAPIVAQFAGFALNKGGFTTPYASTVTLQPVCYGPWCGSVTPDVQSLFFAKVDGDAVIIEANPCGGQIFPDPSQALLDTMTACMNGNCP